MMQNFENIWLFVQNQFEGHLDIKAS